LSLTADEAVDFAVTITPMTEADCPYVSRGGIKLAAALDAFGLSVTGAVCADLGCNVGGFTDCLLQRGATRVFAVDTGYGALAWKLRQDARVSVHERSNALHLDPATVPGFDAGCALVVIDLGWTRQAHAIPAAIKWLSRDPSARIISLIKPHYESERAPTRGPRRGVLDEGQAAEIAQKTLEAMPALGVRVLGQIVSPIRGGHSRGMTGNVEYLAMLARG
jgi:23S rRNA (cytidine1920-2'-O)/16S rRNA (cytidine1409-2'-O)-methyltransferase